MFKKIFIFCSLLLFFAVNFISCKKADDIARDIKRGFEVEVARYSELQSASQNRIRGERSFRVLENWANAVASIKRNIDLLDERLVRHPEERARIDARFFAELRGRMDRFFSRVDTPRLLMPAWHMDPAQRSRASLIAAQVDLRVRYQRLFQGTAPGDEAKSPMDIELDSRLYDTKPACIQALTIFGSSHNDPNCATYANSVCTHQMRITSCLLVQISLANSQHESCTTQICSPAGEGHTCREETAPWVLALSQCDSPNVPIEDPLR